MSFPDFLKDPADVADYTMDWTNHLSGSVQIRSITTSVNGDVTVADQTASYPATKLTLQISGGSGVGWTGDNQIAELSVVTVVATLTDGEVMSRSFNVVVRQM